MGKKKTNTTRQSEPKPDCRPPVDSAADPDCKAQVKELQNQIVELEERIESHLEYQKLTTRLQELTNKVFGKPTENHDSLEGRVAVLVDRSSGHLPFEVTVDLVSYFIEELNKWDARRVNAMVRFMVEHHGMVEAKKVCDYLCKKNKQMRAIAPQVWRQTEAWYRIEGESMEKNRTRPLRADYEQVPEGDSIDADDDFDDTGVGDENPKDLASVATPISDVT